MKMKELKYDVCRIYIESKKSNFYFIRNNHDKVFESYGMDLSSLVYMLIFKLRDYRQEHQAYVRLLKEGNFDLREKPYYRDDEIIDLADSCTRDENFLFKIRSEEIDLSLLNEFDELECMSYVSKFNPRRNFYNGYSTYESGMKEILNILTRSMKFDDVMKKLILNLKKVTGRKEIEDLMEVEDIKNLIKGPNGDLWCKLFLKTNIPEFEKYQVLYQAQPYEILKNKRHLENIEFIRFAIDGAKNNHQKMKILFEKLPLELQENPQVLNFYKWHRECS